jgi:hypothetical protein
MTISYFEERIKEWQKNIDELKEKGIKCTKCDELFLESRFGPLCDPCGLKQRRALHLEKIKKKLIGKKVKSIKRVEVFRYEISIGNVSITIDEDDIE